MLDVTTTDIMESLPFESSTKLLKMMRTKSGDRPEEPKIEASHIS